MVLGDVEYNLTLTIEPVGITYVDDNIWALQRYGDLYKLDSSTGAEISHYNLPFDPAGITYDGNYFYISVYPGAAGNNGSIYKYQKDGTLVSGIHLPITSGYLCGLAHGMV